MTEDVDKLIDEMEDNVPTSAFSDNEAPEQTEPVQEEVQPEIAQPTEGQPSYINVHSKFEGTADQIDYVIAATNQKEKMVAANGEIRMMHGRFYFIPVNCSTDIDSDSCANMKVFSDVAARFDVRYVKNGLACIMPLKHNITIKNDQRLCILW